MAFENIKVAVTSPSFCRDDHLRELLIGHFPMACFNQGDRLDERALKSFLAGQDAAIVGIEPISKNLLRSLPDLRVISKFGVGLDNIDLEALKECGVYLGWTPGTNAQSVAELTLCFMLGLMRNVFCSASHLKNGRWKKDGGRQLAGKTVGIIGCGNVGKAVVRLLAPFNCYLLVNDIVDDKKFYQDYNITSVGIDDLMIQSDIVSLHVPLDATTKHMMNEQKLRMMKRCAFLINTSRGAVVDTAVLKRALEEEWIAGAALDVFEKEPPEDRKLMSFPNLMVSPHIGGNAAEAVQAMGESAIEHLVRYFSEHNRIR